MAWTVPHYAPSEIDSAGKQLASNPRALSTQQFDILNNFRASHGFPLNTLQMRLRGRAHQIDRDAVVNQRIKRRQSIAAKLGKMGSLKLSKMQDVGGCRAVVQTAEQVDRLVALYKTGWARHTLTKENNYIMQPKASGYRSIHLVYTYHSDRSPVFNGTRVEIQFRSHLQHIWAMAVETVGKMTGHSLKSGLGAPDHLRFFELMSSYFAILEDKPTVPNTPSSIDELKDLIRCINNQVKIVETVELYTVVANIIGRSGPGLVDSLFLIDLNTKSSQLDGKSFFRRDYSSMREQHEAAFEEYRRLEHKYSEDMNHDIVLVSAKDINTLRLAYPSYFGDMSTFIDLVRNLSDM